MTFNHDKNPFKRRMCIQEYHCMYSLGGEVSKMTCNRDKNSLQAKVVNSGNTIACRALGVKFRK